MGRWNGAALRICAVIGMATFGWGSPAAAQQRVVARVEVPREREVARMPEPLLVARTDTAVGLPLAEESARVEIDGQHATTTVRHVYVNRSGTRVEGRFVLRAGEGANVEGFAYWNGDQKIVGEVMERAAARAIYDGTVNQKRDPGLLEKTGEGTFSFRVFPIEASERKRVEVGVSQWLPRRDRTVEYRLPLARASSEVEVSIRDERRIRRVTSSSHAIEVDGQGTTRMRVRVGAANGGPEGPRELVLRYEVEEPMWKLHAVAHKDAGQMGYLLVSLAAPPFDGELSQDLTVVLDSSQTMAGEPLRQARAAAGRIVQRMRAADRLNVVVLSGEPRALFREPRWVTREVRDEAIAFLLESEEGRSGDLARGLEAALRAQDDAPRPRTVLVLSDGRSGARRALQIAERDSSDTRVFTVGFGAQVDKPALSRMASLKRGRFALVESSAAIPARMDKLSQQIATPMLSKLSLHADGATIRHMYPAKLPDLYPGQELVVLARLDAADGAAPARLSLKGQGQKPVTLTTSVDASRSARRPWVGKLWARERVGDLLEEIALRGAREPAVSETIELALAYDIVTPYTAFLAIPESELSFDAAQSLAEQRKRKQQILAMNEDAAMLTEGQAQPSNVSMLDAPGAMAPAPSPESGEMDDGSGPMSVRHGGCAGCRVGEGSNDRGALSLLLVGIALVALRRRSARSEQGPVA